jgi:hypothetical protein
MRGKGIGFADWLVVACGASPSPAWTGLRFKAAKQDAIDS